MPVLQLTIQVVNKPSKAHTVSFLNFWTGIIVKDGFWVNKGKRRIQNCGDYRLNKLIRKWVCVTKSLFETKETGFLFRDFGFYVDLYKETRFLDSSYFNHKNIS
ncbi:hypothetical protein DSM106972_022830 [Dulcicalothrix desertica PCC 7102]|uniref:Uncharacterized protein n=1 Tax=Dulcicalothrix desertica PCC 7102 TaxID=232991 RepID=A0A3S1AQY4_9CYAN|nr:hypothetical protein DSM106972_022830 [Dulcicalothrix desertica PCC 7102]